MEFGISTLALHDEKLKDMLEDVNSFKEEYSFNINHMEILFDYPHNPLNTDLINSYNLNYSIHSPISDINIAALNEGIRVASINEIKKSIDTAAKINAELVVVHPGKLAFLNQKYLDKALTLTYESLQECKEYADNIGINITLENMPTIPGFLYQNLEETNNLAIKLNIPMTLDIGHAATAGYDIKDTFFKNIQHIHLSNNDGKSDLHWQLDKGTIDIKSFLQLFEENGFNGVYLLEIEEKEDLIKSLDYLEKNNI